MTDESDTNVGEISAKVQRIEKDFFPVSRIIEVPRRDPLRSALLATERYRIARRIKSIGRIVIQSAGTKGLTNERHVQSGRR